MTSLHNPPLPAEEAPLTLRGRALEARFLRLGATLQSLWVADAVGARADVVLGFDSAPEYLRAPGHFGGVIGRYANRIARGELPIRTELHPLVRNLGPHHLHGGESGFDRRLWQVERARQEGREVLEFRLLSPDGDQGYPGALAVRARFCVGGASELRVELAATCDRTTVVNLTHHPYWNLAGAGCGDVLSHRLQIFAERYTPVDRDGIPTGELRLVAGTPLDFRSPRAIGERIDALLGERGGYDHNFVLDKPPGAAAPAARLVDPASGRVLEIETTQPGLQLYSGNFIGDVAGKGGRRYTRFHGVCLEPQHFPDSPHHPGFPSTLLEPADVYAHHIVYRFGVA